jgi:hypothetical protein
MKWLESDGGPLVLIPASVLTQWRGSGIERYDPVDYDMACSIRDFVGLLDFRTKKILVFGDEPTPAIVTTMFGEPCVIRWFACESQELAEKVISSIPRALPEFAKALRCEILEEEHLLFDAALPGMLTEGASHKLLLERGTYLVTTEPYCDTKNYDFLVHRFKRQIG